MVPPPTISVPFCSHPCPLSPPPSGAVDDFSAAIDIEPRYADTWKRRGQSLSAIGGRDDQALSDLAKALELLPLMGQVRGLGGGQGRGGQEEVRQGLGERGPERVGVGGRQGGCFEGGQSHRCFAAGKLLPLVGQVKGQEGRGEMGLKGQR